ncbi:hypothetical protein IWZ00DRAFT_528286 [Phyllosticta capitalensis]|uniref:Transmembrane protein n=1 Tax=Phyllosticta capitalensis TaxID=121624 RepID=A0ABR1YZC9_9PEZI
MTRNYERQGHDASSVELQSLDTSAAQCQDHDVSTAELQDQAALPALPPPVHTRGQLSSSRELPTYCESQSQTPNSSFAPGQQVTGGQTRTQPSNSTNAEDNRAFCTCITFGWFIFALFVLLAMAPDLSTGGLVVLFIFSVVVLVLVEGLEPRADLAGWDGCNADKITYFVGEALVLVLAVILYVLILTV